MNPVFHFEQTFENEPIPVTLGRLDIRGYIIRWYFTPDGVQLVMPLALRDHPAIHWHAPGVSQLGVVEKR